MTRDQAKVGTKVIYWAIIGAKGERLDPMKTIILCEPYYVSGHLVCKVHGKAAAVSITHLDPITPGSLLAAKLQGLKDISDKELEEVIAKFFKDHGANIKFGDR